MATWNTVKSSKVVWAPMGTRRTKSGEIKPRFGRIGIRIDMADGGWWFYSFRHGSWTQHFPAVQKLDRLGRPAVEAGVPVMLTAATNRYKSWDAVQREFGGRSPAMIAALQSGREGAEAEAAEEAAE